MTDFKLKYSHSQLLPCLCCASDLIKNGEYEVGVPIIINRNKIIFLPESWRLNQTIERIVNVDDQGLSHICTEIRCQVCKDKQKNIIYVRK